MENHQITLLCVILTMMATIGFFLLDTQALKNTIDKTKEKSNSINDELK